MYHNKKFDGPPRHRHDFVPEWNSFQTRRSTGDQGRTKFVVIRPSMQESAEDFPGAVGLFLADLRNGMFKMKLDAARKHAV
eukprot:3630247-Karenia_brevis.AAC.1